MQEQTRANRLCLFSHLGELLRNKTGQLHYCGREKNKTYLKKINMQVKGKKSQDDKKGCTVTVRTKVKVDVPSVRVQRQTSNKHHVHGQEEERKGIYLESACQCKNSKHVQMREKDWISHSINVPLKPSAYFKKAPNKQSSTAKIPPFPVTGHIH